ncbi:MAG: hypothetical protein ACD_65C00015G0006 [uncultured bacterium]|nr:MAG: hypothetical protein ACD_65C00015G0006 [uncultured bacterium]OGJ47570.1 MAG: hypothetical protein A2244_00705 [Candidatus Peregrinibacteria bacterium RIFOXYA2_FULL_41_18]OGJ49629.1 MAG: hypothetical protein A2344_02405 [Candidatus Peregrinibacteria bacterium RIFOXYB12_FULL_41_12]OGJ53149.1 MAG: hypothetical protein A2448_03180 [Candidatus Peregrinibacteria bacterium RIFOXYC2_FULL_41_22]
MGFDMPNLGELVDKGKEAMKGAVKEASKDLQEFREWSRYVITGNESDGKKFAEKYAQETAIDNDHAQMVAQFAEKTWDPDTMTNYLTNKQPGTLDPSTMYDMLRFGDQCYFANYSEYSPRTSEESDGIIDYYSQLIEKGETINDDRYLMQYGKEMDIGKWENKAPEYLAALSPEQKAEAYNMNPIGYARTFPSSALVKGDILEKIVKEEVDWLTSQGLERAANVGQIGREANKTLLANPNLTPAQRASICAAIKSIDLENRLQTEGARSMDTIVRNIALNPTSAKDFVETVSKFYGPRFKKGYMSAETYAAIESRAQKIMENNRVAPEGKKPQDKQISYDDYKMLLDTKRFVPGNTEANKSRKLTS